MRTIGKHNPGTASHHFSIGTYNLLDEVELDELQYEDYDPDEDESDQQDEPPPVLYAEEDDFTAESRRVRAQKQMWEVARTILGHANASPRLMAHAVAYAMYV